MRRHIFSMQYLSFAIFFVLVGVLITDVVNRPARVTAQVTSSGTISATLIPRFISLPVETAVINNGASYELNGGGDLSGMAFPNGGFPRFSTGFSLPPDYAVGTDIIVRITWGNSRFNATNCGVRLRANGVSAFRPSTSPIYGNFSFPESTYYDGTEITLDMPSSSEQIGQTMAIISGKDNLENNIFQPGDNLVLRLARDDGDVQDTCTGKLFILGMNATYQGQTNYLPLVTN